MRSFVLIILLLNVSGCAEALRLIEPGLQVACGEPVTQPTPLHTGAGWAQLLAHLPACARMLVVWEQLFHQIRHLEELNRAVDAMTAAPGVVPHSGPAPGLLPFSLASTDGSKSFANGEEIPLLLPLPPSLLPSTLQR